MLAAVSGLSAHALHMRLSLLRSRCGFCCGVLSSHDICFAFFSGYFVALLINLFLFAIVRPDVRCLDFILSYFPFGSASHTAERTHGKQSNKMGSIEMQFDVFAFQF